MGGGKPVDFDGLKSELEEHERKVSDLRLADPEGGTDAPMPGFAKRLARAVMKGLDDRPAAPQGAEKAAKANPAEQHGAGGDGPAGSSGKQSGLGAERHEAAPSMPKDGARPNGASTSAAAKDGGKPMRSAGEAGSAASTDAAAGRGVRGESGMLQVGPAMDGTGSGARQIASQLSGQPAPNGAAAAPKPGAGLPQAAGNLPASAPASAQAAAAAAAAALYAATTPRTFPSHGQNGAARRHAEDSSSDDDGDDSAESGAEGKAVGGARGRRPAQLWVTGKPSSDSDSNDDGGASPDDGLAAGTGPGKAASAAGRGRSKREAPAPGLAHDKWPPVGTADYFEQLRLELDKAMGQLPSRADDPRAGVLKKMSRPLKKYLGVMAQRDADPVPSTPALNYMRSADPELAAAIASGDVFEIVFAIMKVMCICATENARQRAVKVRGLNADQERVRSVQQEVRELAQGFKPGADASTPLKDKGSGKTGADLDKQLEGIEADLEKVGWDKSKVAGGAGLTQGTTKQQLDDLVANLDTRLTTYSNMNSLETNDLTREGQAAQAFLTAMNGILTNENRALTGIASSWRG
ncbi:hypothetical protein ASB57_28905 [Bordetella sp. N]|nr:hypothetical protein ASB57_28905 [Bordetella sp. N]